MRGSYSSLNPPADFKQYLNIPKVVWKLLKDDGIFPNNPEIPLVIFQKAVIVTGGDSAAILEGVFAANRWGNSWRNGIYGFHHYHSTAHEVLGVYKGFVKIQFGGEQGMMVDAAAGDVVIIPAGVAHKNLGASPDFGCVGAYPVGQKYDMNYGKVDERPRTDRKIGRVPLPKTDPVYGEKGPLLELWTRKK